MPHQQKRIYYTHYEWLSLIYQAADVDAILQAIRDVDKSHINVYDLQKAIEDGVTIEVIK